MALFRGGRLVKWKGVVASIAPAAVAVVLADTAPAPAADECGIAGGPLVVCNAPSYPSGIAYTTDAGGNPTTLTLDNPAMVVGPVAGKGADLENPTLIGGAAINLDALTSITSTGDFGGGVAAEIRNPLSTGAATVTQSAGSISTAGRDSFGILVRQQGLGAATVSLQGGTIATSGDRSIGALIEQRNTASTAAATATLSSGSISTAGLEASGIAIDNQGLGVATVDVLSGSIVTAGDRSDGVFVENRNATSTGTATITQTGGSITTGGESAAGLRVATDSSEGAASVAINGGSISTTGRFATGASTSAGATDPTATATVLQAGGTISTTGEGASGLRATSFGRGAATVAVQSGTVTTAGLRSSGAIAEVNDPDSTAAASVIQTGGTISTAGEQAHGLLATHTGRGAAEVDVRGGSITTTADEARGALAQVATASSIATTTATISGGEISTNGRVAHGLQALNEGLGAATVTVGGGTITTSGVASIAAIAEVANAGSAAAATATMTDGTITAGDIGGFNSDGLVALNAGLGAALVDVRGGTITARGERSDGARATVANATSTAAATARMTDGIISAIGIAAVGNDAHGLLAQNQGLGEAVVDIRDGRITASGSPDTDAARAEVLNMASTAAARVTMAGGAVLSGADGSGGLAALNEGLGAATVSVDGGTILTDRTGASASVLNQDSTAEATVTMTAGTLATGAVGAEGLNAVNFGQGRALVDIQGGTITTAGNAGSGARASVESRLLFGSSTSTAAATVTMTGGILSTTGSDASAILARNNGLGEAVVTIASGTITTTGGSSVGAIALVDNDRSTAAARATFSGGSITAGGLLSNGLLARNEGLGEAVVAVDGGSIATAGERGAGAQALILSPFSTASAMATQTAGDISTTGDLATGLSAVTLGTGMATVEARVGTIATTGNEAHGAHAFGIGLLTTTLPPTTTVVPGSEATVLHDGAVTTTAGVGAHGLYGLNTGRGDAMVTVRSGTVTTTGASGHGAYALVANGTSGARASVNLSGGTVTASGADADGLRAGSVGIGSHAITVTGGSVTGGAGTGAAIRTFGPTGGTVTIEAGATVLAGASGIAIRDGDAGIDSNGDGLADWIDGDGNGSADYDNNGNGFLDVGFDFGAGAGDDATVANPANPFVLDGVDEPGTAGNVTVAMNGGSVTGNVILGLGDDTITLASGVLDGDIYGDDVAPSANDGNDTFTWTGGTWLSSFFGGNGSDVVNVSAPSYDGTLHVLDGGDDHGTADGAIDRLTLTGVNTNALGANIVNWEQIILDGSILRITDGALQAGDTTVLTGVQLTGGALLDGGAAFALTGNLFTDAGTTFDITGGGAGVYSVSGTTVNDGTITMQDGATGDMLTVAGNYLGSGALRIDVDTATDALDSLVVNGSVTGGTTTVFVNNLSPLVATGNPLTVVTVGGTSVAGGFALDGGFLSAGPFDYVLAQRAGNFVLQARLSPTAATYLAAPAVLGGFNRIPSLKERVDGRLWARGDRARTGTWVRLQGSGLEADLSTGDSFTRDQYGVQAGLDLALEPGESGQVVVGITMQYGTLSSSVGALLGTGSIDADGFGLGATATWYGNGGSYLDLQGQANRIQTEMSSSRDGLLVSNHAVTAVAVSVEAGHEIAMSETATLTPQAQLSWGTVDGGSFVDSAGNTVALGDNESMIGRLGLAYEIDRTTGRGHRRKGYVIGNILHDFSPEASVSVAGMTLGAEPEATWAELGLGGSLGFGSGKSSVYGEVAYSTSLDGDRSANRGLRLTAGLRMEF